MAELIQMNQGGPKNKTVLVCHFCNESGHKALYCNKMTPDQRAEQARIENEPFFKKFTMQTKIGKMYMQQILTQSGPSDGSGAPGSNPVENIVERSRLFRGHPKPLEEVTCYKCGVKGHYANRCPKGHLAFLSKAQSSYDENDRN